MNEVLPISAIPGAETSSGSRSYFRRPVVWISLVILVVNDHALKTLAAGSGWSVMTGKVSDFAGAILLVAWLDVVLRVCGIARIPAARAAAVLTACVIVLLECSQVAAAAYVAASQLVFDAVTPGWTAATTRDPTDLLALFFVAIAYRGCLKPARVDTRFR